MRQAVLVRPGCIELREAPVPAAPPGGILVRVRCALTDGTDLKAYRRGHPKMPMPTPFGHEFSGDVAAVGEAVNAFAIGDGVMCVHSAPCGFCYWCLAGQEEFCESIMPAMILGAYAEYIAVPERIVAVNAYAKPPDLSYTAAAFLEPLACVVHSVDALALHGGECVVVMGDGGFGILHAAVLKEAGARPLLAGRRAERLAVAQLLGVADVINVREGGDLPQIVRDLTQGRGADAAIECTGMRDVWEHMPALVRRGGAVSFFGGLPPGSRVSFDAARMHYDGVRLISPFHFRPGSVRLAYDLLTSKAVDPLPLVSETAELPDIGRIFQRLDDGEGIKFAIAP